MGRIEDAVEKLQRAARLSPPNTPRTFPGRQLGSIVPSKTGYEGKHIAVDLEQLRISELLVPETESRRIAEQYRAIKRPLLRNADRRREPVIERGNLLMIASALPGEGKTFTCINLSLSIAREKDWQVVLVDADCSKPHLSRLFAAEQEPGLLDLLRDNDAKFDSFVMPTDIPGLSILPAGSADGDAAELLASKRMEDLCNVLSAEGTGRIIVFDSSPLLLTSEAVALATHVGQIAIVVRANETPQGAVVAALQRLDSRKAIGCILNRTYGAGVGLEQDGYGYADYGY